CTTTPSCADQPNERYLPLVESPVDITVTADGFETYDASSVPAASLDTITLQPTPICFNAELVFDGVPAADVAALAETVALSVPVAPPGAGNVGVSTGAVNGNRVRLQWRDSRIQGGGASCAGGQIRPGVYRV